MSRFTRNARLLKITLLLIASALLVDDAIGKPIPAGAGQFRFDADGGPPLTVWTYRPERHGVSDPVLFVIHGTKRNADDYRDAWIKSAESLGVLLLVPQFTKRDYPASWAYQQAGVTARDDTPRPRADWTPQRVEGLFDSVVAENGLQAKRYFIYGHSAGGQFVHRMLLTMPEARVELAIPANPGWYTLPLLDKGYPEGLAGTPVDAESLRQSLGSNVVVLLGDADTDTEHKSLPRNAAAMRQGPHRFARGKNFYRQLKATAEEFDAPLNWRVSIAPGVGHSNSKMAPFAAGVILRHLQKQQAN